MLRVGQFVRARVEIDRHENVLSISKEALLYKDGQPIVYTIEEIPKEEQEEQEEKRKNDENKKQSTASESDTGEENGPKYRAKAIDIKIGYSDEENVEIIEGITSTDRVITLGNTALRANSPIEFEEKEP